MTTDAWEEPRRRGFSCRVTDEQIRRWRALPPEVNFSGLRRRIAFSPRPSHRKLAQSKTVSAVGKM